MQERGFREFFLEKLGVAPVKVGVDLLLSDGSVEELTPVFDVTIPAEHAALQKYVQNIKAGKPKGVKDIKQVVLTESEAYSRSFNGLLD